MLEGRGERVERKSEEVRICGGYRAGRGERVEILKSEKR